MDQSGTRIVVPEIADFEIRRELERLGNVPGLRRLDALAQVFLYAEITTPVMRRAAEFWADVRRRGLPTAGDQSLDADAILAAQAALIGGPGDTAAVATGNVSHLARFPGIHAQDWYDDCLTVRSKSCGRVNRKAPGQTPDCLGWLVRTSHPVPGCLVIFSESRNHPLPPLHYT